jgi:hypothetical protein
MAVFELLAHAEGVIRLWQQLQKLGDVCQGTARSAEKLRTTLPGGKRPSATGFVEKSANAYDRDIPVGLVESQLDPNAVPTTATGVASARSRME